MGDEYQLLNVGGVKEDNRQIVAILAKLADGTLENDLRLLNYFHEIPVSYPGTVENVEDEMVDVAVHQNQAVVMYYQKMTFLKSRHFPYDVAAKVFRSDVNKCIAILSKFAYAQIRAERRQFVRVKLDPKVPAMFHFDGGKLAGNIDDMSLGGMCISAERLAGLETNGAGHIEVVLEDEPLKIPAVLLRIREEEDLPQYVFECEMDSKLENKISHFIFQRQLEIIRQLKDRLA